MKTTALFVVSLAAASAFAPTPAGRTSTQISESLFDKVRLCELPTLRLIAVVLLLLESS